MVLAIASTLVVMRSQQQIIALVEKVGFIIWNRHSTLRPLERRMRSLEEDLERDLELKAPEGPRLTGLIQALRDLATEDPKVEAVMRSYWIL